MKSFLGIVVGLIIIAIAGLFGFGVAAAKGWIPTPQWLREALSENAGAPDQAPSSPNNPEHAQAERDQQPRPFSEGGLFLGQGANPIRYATDATCFYSVEAGTVTGFFVEDDAGRRVHDGTLRVWIKGDCPAGGTVERGAFNVIRQRLYINCNSESVWQEFVKYEEDGKEIQEHPEDLQGAALARSERGEIIEPGSVLSPILEKVCPTVESGTPVK